MTDKKLVRVTDNAAVEQILPDTEDVCRRLRKLQLAERKNVTNEDVKRAFPKVEKHKNNTITLRGKLIIINHCIANGRFGEVYTGSWVWSAGSQKKVAIKINQGNRDRKLLSWHASQAASDEDDNENADDADADVRELEMHIFLWCLMRGGTFWHAAQARRAIGPGRNAGEIFELIHIARIPKPLFSCTVPGMGRLVGMEMLAKPLVDVLLNWPEETQLHAFYSSALEFFRVKLVEIARLLELLQSLAQFMHGDLHGSNIMLNHASRGCLVDFGMASIRGQAPTT